MLPAISCCPVVTNETILLILVICTLLLNDTSPSTSILPVTETPLSSSRSPVIKTLSFNIVVSDTSNVFSITTSPVNAVVSALLPTIALAGIDSFSKRIIPTDNDSALPDISLAFKNIFPVIASPPIIT